MVLTIRAEDLKIQMTNSIYEFNNYSYVSLRGKYVKAWHVHKRVGTYTIYLNSLNYIIRENKVKAIYILGFKPFIESKFFK